MKKLSIVVLAICAIAGVQAMQSRRGMNPMQLQQQELDKLREFRTQANNISDQYDALRANRSGTQSEYRQINTHARNLKTEIEATSFMLMNSRPLIGLKENLQFIIDSTQRVIDAYNG